MMNPSNPIMAPLVGKFDTSMILAGNLLECEEKCSFGEWASFIHFAVTENGQLCFGNTSSCDCASLLCIGDTIRLRGPTGRYGTLQIPYSTPKPNALLSHQYDWLEFCRDNFLESGLDVVCRQLNFAPHKTYAILQVSRCDDWGSHH
ncbi:hypothetical protein RvY_01824-1 [Ramazzottius varieornatus]|uniref:SRCR domain-containing protein n=1 Tax=Ramazzottius varieornatus TaxID=947166 RepID=A0A1D1USC1_RAMVA|nr:hypothetical protein RvY_01824-1 [Ramazzottius varieornatus]